MFRVADILTDIYCLLDRDSLDNCQLISRYDREIIDARLTGACLRTVCKAECVQSTTGRYSASILPGTVSLYDDAYCKWSSIGLEGTRELFYVRSYGEQKPLFDMPNSAGSQKE